METAARFSALARRDLPLVEYAREFCGLAVCTALDDVTLNSLFWIGANYYHSVDLPDTTGLSWREGNLRCLESVQPRSRISPPAHSLSAVPQSSPPSAADSSPPAATTSSPPAAAHVPLGILVEYDGMSWNPAPELAPVSAPAQERPPVPAYIHGHSGRAEGQGHGGLSAVAPRAV